ncbi:hypothetical protein SAMN05216297_102421 [Flavobacterium phragmitis]|uniref:Uncharacterized protein n=1 Tax=Flavobacterium phragmitis TaxID=739143 RepID=A0A1I1MBY1_9FLAO|nr:hypothetical protein SAMN05216297_102421 [Flavobacterium phragmitis]
MFFILLYLCKNPKENDNKLKIKYLTQNQIIYEEKLPCFVLLSLMSI